MKEIALIGFFFLGLFPSNISVSNSGEDLSHKFYVSVTRMEHKASTDELQITTRIFIDDLEKLLEDLPDPSLVPFTLKSIGAEFDKAHINALDKIESYKSNRDKMALNMGIYASDISYLAAYGHEEDCIDYLRASHGMAEFLGDSAIYNEDDLNEFRGHIASQNEDEISRILGRLFLETSLKMEEDHHLTMAGWSCFDWKFRRRIVSSCNNLRIFS